MNFPTILSRRAMLKASAFVPLATAALAAAAPVAASQAEGMYLDAETTALVTNWQRLIRERQALEAEIKERGIHTPEMIDHPLRGRLNGIYADENDAQHAVTRALRKAGAA